MVTCFRQEIRAREFIAYESVPECVDGWYYYRKIGKKGQHKKNMHSACFYCLTCFVFFITDNYITYCRKKGSLDAPEEVNHKIKYQDTNTRLFFLR